MRAAALLQRLPHTAAASERPPRARRRRHGKPTTTATRAANLSQAPSAARRDAGSASGPSTAGSQIVQRARLAGGPIDNASYTCACGFVFAASVSTTVACPHCGASQAW
jgi:hypothetical protein